MVNILTGARGPHVPLPVEEEHNRGNEPVQIHLHNLEEKNAPTNRNNRKFAIQITAQWMVNMASGVCGQNVLLPVGLELQCVKEFVQIHRHNMEVNHALDQQMKQRNAKQNLVQFVRILPRNLNVMTK